jgi:hypothetical protein
MARYVDVRADRLVVEQAAAHLRHQAILADYAGMENKPAAFALALILDELARHVRDVPGEVRATVV